MSVYCVALTGMELSFVYGPSWFVARYTKYPNAEEALGIHDKFTECGALMPVPNREIVVGELTALLEIAMAPAAIPAPKGAKTIFNVAVPPGARIIPEGTPLALKPGPVTLTFEIVM